MTTDFTYTNFNQTIYNKLFSNLYGNKENNAQNLNKLLQLFFSSNLYKNKRGEYLTGDKKQNLLNVNNDFFDNIIDYDPTENIISLEAILHLCIVALTRFVDSIAPNKNNQHEINKLSNYIFVILRGFGYHYKCLVPLVNCIKKTVNDIMGENYLIIDCRDISEYNVCDDSTYTCGRAIYPNSNILSNNKIIIYNTVSEYDMDVDINYVVNKYAQLHGGSNKYYRKYLKYKNKYLNLKNNIV